jgi:hypothetical protein
MSSVGGDDESTSLHPLFYTGGPLMAGGFTGTIAKKLKGVFCYG